MPRLRCPECNNFYDPPSSFCPIDGKPLTVFEEGNSKLLGMVLDGKYKIESLIGKGGMGSVYVGKHLHIGIPVAIKILHSHLISDDTSVERFRREARSALAVNHPNAMSVMDFGVTANNRVLYLVMEFIEGVSLYDLLEKEGALDIVRTVNIMRQVCQAVGAAHQKRIVHRDLKPDNILIIDCGSLTEAAKVIDFSIAKMFTDGTSEQMNLTRADVVLGTPEYLSPEQAQGFRIDHRSDIYSLGIIIYQMLTGDVPFTATTATAVLLKHVDMLPRPLREIRPEIPPELEYVVLRSLAKTPNQRPQSATQLAEEMESALISSGLVEQSPLHPRLSVMAGNISPEGIRLLVPKSSHERDSASPPSNGAQQEEKKPGIWDKLFKR